MITTIERANETKTTTTETIRISAFCDTCDNNDYGTKKELTSAGWELSPSYQFCPNCSIG
jgi:hypothetical protein